MSSATTLLKVVNDYTAEDVLNFCSEKKAKQLAKHDTPEKPEDKDQPAVIVIDSKMTPLEASKILWSKDIMVRILLGLIRLNRSDVHLQISNDI